MVDQSIVISVSRYLDALKQKGVQVHFGVIFGSQATGRAHQWSDIDLLVISPQFDGIRRREDINLLWHVAADTDNRIEPIPIGLHQFETEDGSPLLTIARREGQIIPIAE
ncbi:MAG: nucleotidyltransferase domain-containing protein [Leptolinea sp.]